MNLTILNTDLLHELDERARPVTALVQLAPVANRYMTTVWVNPYEDSSLRVCLYAESHDEPRIAEDILADVHAFNADPDGQLHYVRRGP